LELENEAKDELRRGKKAKREISLLDVKLADLSVMFIDIVGFWVCVGVRVFDQTVHVV
jgi:hypothetical protein